MRAWPLLLARLLLCLLLACARPALAASSYSADSAASNATLYPWIDIAATGTSVPLGDDAVSGAINLGFSFTFGSTAYSAVKVMSNGMLQFGATSTAYANAPLPLNGGYGRPAIDAVLIPLWDDLLPGSGQVRYRSQGTAPNRVFVVSWLAVPYYGGSSSQKATFQVQLHEQGKIVFRYGTVDGSGGAHSPTGAMSNPNGAVIGLELNDNDYLQYARFSASVPSGTTIVFTPSASSTPTPVLEYLFNEAAWSGASGEVRDTSGSGWHGTAASLSATKPSTASATPAIGGATGTCQYGVFNRANKDYVALPSGVPNFGSSGSFTVTAWIRASDASLPNQRIFADDQNNSSGFALSLGDPGGGRLRFFSRGTGSQLSLETDAVIASNTWYFVAFGIDTGTRTKRIHVYNSAGSQLAAVSASYSESSFGADSGAASIGGENNASPTEANNNFGFGGNLDEVRVYTSALSTGQLAAVRALTSTCATATLVAEYRFEENAWAGSAGELKDSAGHVGGPYHGRAQGSAMPAVASASPARSGNPGTCGYASLPGPISNGGSFVVAGLPVSTAAGAQTTVAFWMYWTGTDGNVAIGWNRYDIGAGGGAFGFNTDNGDVYGIPATGLANGWHHVVAVFTNGSVTSNKLYIDGVAQTMSQRFGTPVLGNATVQSTMTIGGYGASTYYRFAGRIDEVRVFNGAVSAADVATLYAETHVCPASLHHLELRLDSAAGLTCAPATLTVVACKDAACSGLYDGGVTGTLIASGPGMSVSWPDGAGFSIPAGSSSVTERVHLTTAGSVLLSASGIAPAPSNSVSCNFGSPQCTYSAAAAALVLDVPDHLAETPTALSIRAIGSSGGSCAAAFASSTRTLNFRCSYANPSSGTRAVRVAGSALNSANNAAAACDGTGRNVSLSFDASGVASTTLLYADVGDLQLTATYTGSSGTGDAGLTMTGSDRFIAAPASFGFSAVTAGPIKAGNAFSATVSARNSAGATTPNFGRESTPETAMIGFSRYQPTGAGASDGSFEGNLGSFSNGSATASDLRWSEVGTGDLSATLASGSYLGSGFSASGSTGSSGAVGRFIPHHFDLVLTPACDSFSYAGQPFTATVTARNADNATTANYDGGGATSPAFAKVVTLAEPSALGVGSLSGGSIAASAFSAGVASASVGYAFSSKATGPRTLALRATDTDGVSSSGFTEGSMALRSGRLRLSNAFGSANAALQLPVVAEYWNGSAWLLNSADSCTALAAASVALSNPRGATGGATTAVSSASAVNLASGSGLLTLAAPTPAGASLSLDVAINLGSGSADQSCHAAHPASTGAARPWLRAQNGSCAASADRDPAARASFGIFSPETRKTVHVREIF